jgi:hypothetical protein
VLYIFSLWANRRFRLSCEWFCHGKSRFAKYFGYFWSLEGVSFLLRLGFGFEGLNLGLFLELLVEGLSLLVLLVYLVFDKLNNQPIILLQLFKSYILFIIIYRSKTLPIHLLPTLFLLFVKTSNREMVKRPRIIRDLDTMTNGLPLSLHTLQTLHTCYAVPMTLAFNLVCEELLRFAV